MKKVKEIAKNNQGKLATALTLAVLVAVYVFVPESREMAAKAISFILSGF